MFRGVTSSRCVSPSGLFALRFAPERFRLAHAGAAGVLLALLALSRTFELAALVVAFGFAALLLAALRLRGPRIWTPLHVVAGAVAFTVTTALVYLETGKRDLFVLYGNNLDEQSGNVVAARGCTYSDVQLRLRTAQARPAVRRALLLRDVLAGRLRRRGPTSPSCTCGGCRQRAVCGGFRSRFSCRRSRCCRFASSSSQHSLCGWLGIVLPQPVESDRYDFSSS